MYYNNKDLIFSVLAEIKDFNLEEEQTGKDGSITGTVELGCGDKADTAAHTEDSGTITKGATETETGIKTYKCTVCGYVIRMETIPATGGDKPVSGDVIVTKPVILDGAPSVDFASLADEVKEVVLLTKEEQEKVANGENVNIWLEIKPVTPTENEMVSNVHCQNFQVINIAQNYKKS